MQEEIQRIITMVQEGKISAEQAAELIDAIKASEPEERERVGARANSEAKKDAFNSLFDTIDRTTRDAMERINWPEISAKIKETTRTGWERIKTDFDQMSRGDWKNIFGKHRDTKQQEITLTLEPTSTFHVELANGDIKVIGGAAEPRIVAEAEIRGKDEEETKTRAAGWSMMVEQSGNDAVLRLPGQNAGTVSVDLVLYLPTGIALDIKSISGDVDITGTNAGVRLTSSSGDTRIVGANGKVQVQSNSGDIHISDLADGNLSVESKSGDLECDGCGAAINVRTASGDLHFRDFSGQAITLETISGDIGVGFREPFSGRCNLRSVSGDIEVDVPDGTSCRVALASVSGAVETGIALKEELKSDRRTTGILGDGAGTIDASAISGDVHLEMKSSN